MGTCDPGLRHIRELVVTDSETSAALGSGDLPVVGTPALLTLAEGACVDAISEDLSDDETSVGTWAEIEHSKPAGIGDKLCANATLIGHHGRRLEFNVLIEHDGELIAKVRHRRVLVDRARFIERHAQSA